VEERLRKLEEEGQQRLEKEVQQRLEEEGQQRLEEEHRCSCCTDARKCKKVGLKGRVFK